MTLSIILLSANNTFATESSDTVRPIITTQGDIYHVSTIPSPVSLKISAFDNVDGKIQVDCDKTSSTVFQLGKTTVRCYAIDSAGNEARTSFVVNVGTNFVKIPNWFKGTTQYWLNHQMSDTEYVSTLKYLLEQKIVHVPTMKKTSDNHVLEIPVWIKSNSQKWIDGKMSNDEFSIGIQWMLERGIIRA